MLPNRNAHQLRWSVSSAVRAPVSDYFKFLATRIFSPGAAMIKFTIPVLFIFSLLGCQGQDVEKLKAENNYLRSEIAKLEAENNQIKSTAWYYFGLGRDHLISDNIAAAVALFQTVIDKFPDDVLADTARDVISNIKNKNLSRNAASNNDTGSVVDSADMANASIAKDENVVGSVGEMNKKLKLDRGRGINYSTTGVFAEKSFGDGSLCASSLSYGYCAPGGESIIFQFGLLSREQESEYFDLRGKIGCLTAQADSNNTVYAVSVHPGPCR